MPLPDDAIVVRGGVGAPKTIAVNAQTTFDTDGFWGVSGFSAADLTAVQIAQLASDQGRLPHGHVRTSTVGRIRSAGFEVEKTADDYPHVDIFLPPDPSDEVCVQLADVFDAPIPNPALSNHAGAQ
jgi:hypothetical protein